jgi:hypothetical protein
MRPAPGMSKGSIRTLPPASLTRAAASSALSTQMYVFHTGVGGAWLGCAPTPATSRPRSWATKYRCGEPAGVRSSNCQPNRSP